MFRIISQALGSKHKVRSFYNNIVAPSAPNGDVTVDTHAVGVALLRPLSGKTIPVMHGLGNAIRNGHQARAAKTGSRRKVGSRPASQ